MTTENEPAGKNNRTVAATCQTIGGCKGFCNLRLAKVNGEIVLDPHVTGCCVISLAETEARRSATRWPSGLADRRAVADASTGTVLIN